MSTIKGHPSTGVQQRGVVPPVRWGWNNVSTLGRGRVTVSQPTESWKRFFSRWWFRICLFSTITLGWLNPLTVTDSYCFVHELRPPTSLTFSYSSVQVSWNHQPVSFEVPSFQPPQWTPTPCVGSTASVLGGSSLNSKMPNPRLCWIN